MGPDAMVIRFDAFTLDAEQRQLFRDGTVVHLTPKAFDLLVLLATHAPRVVSKRELHEQLWPGTFVADATLTGVVKELRRALDDRSPTAPLIRTAHRVGYALCPAIERVSARQAAPQHWLVLRGRRVALHDGDYVIGRDASFAEQSSSSQHWRCAPRVQRRRNLPLRKRPSTATSATSITRSRPRRPRRSATSIRG